MILIEGLQCQKVHKQICNENHVHYIHPYSMLALIFDVV